MNKMVKETLNERWDNLICYAEGVPEHPDRAYIFEHDKWGWRHRITEVNRETGKEYAMSSIEHQVRLRNQRELTEEDIASERDELLKGLKS